jgi:hypothetical protein
MRRVLAVLAIAAAGPAIGCSLLDWSGYTDGGASDPGDAGDASAPSCGTAEKCAPLLTDDAGWTGPLTLYPATSQPPGCGTGFSSFYEIDGGPASCTSCSCGRPDGSTCSAPVVSFYSDGNCQTPCGQDALVTKKCVPPTCGGSFMIGNSVPQGGGCPASGGAPTLPPAMVESARACPLAASLPSSSCGPDRACLQTPMTPDPPRLCYMRAGRAGACPAAPYIFGPEVYFTDPEKFTDTRGCSACTCGAPGGGSCTNPIALNLRTDSMCNFPGLNLPFMVPAECQSLNNQGFLITADFALSPGSCVPDGGAPTGSVTSSSPVVSFCCTSQRVR